VVYNVYIATVIVFALIHLVVLSDYYIMPKPPGEGSKYECPRFLRKFS